MSFYDTPPLWQSGVWAIFHHPISNTEADTGYAVVNILTGFADYPICYDCGVIAYDRPEAIPKRVQSAVRRLFTPKGWYMHFHGGHSKAVFNVHEDKPEFFDTLEDAKSAFASRTVDCDRRYPCTDETAEAWLFAADPRKTGCEYPDRVITLGPRNGVRLERA